MHFNEHLFSWISLTMKSTYIGIQQKFLILMKPQYLFCLRTVGMHVSTLSDRDIYLIKQSHFQKHVA